MKVLLMGPKACGKTRNAEKIAKAFNLTSVVEMEDLRRNYPFSEQGDGLFVCNKLPADVKEADFDVVITVNTGI